MIGEGEALGIFRAGLNGGLEAARFVELGLGLLNLSLQIGGSFCAGVGRNIFRDKRNQERDDDDAAEEIADGIGQQLHTCGGPASSYIPRRKKRLCFCSSRAW